MLNQPDPPKVVPFTPERVSVACLIAAAGLLILTGPACAETSRQLLIAPHISGEAFCDRAANDVHLASEDDAAMVCAKNNENAANRISALLDKIGPPASPSGHFALGYMLDLPLLRFYTKGTAGWTLNQQAIDSSVRLIHDIDRPVVVYLSANHFTDGGIELSNELARDPANLMWTKHGPLDSSAYFAISLHAWTLTNQEARINVLRRQAFSAALNAICRLDPQSRARIRGVSLLGEVHQLYGNFAAGQGFASGFDVTDYSPSAVAGFTRFLAARYTAVDALNRAIGGHYTSFAEVAPPSKDITKDVLHSFLEHIDAFAAGTVAVQGWAYDPSGEPVHLAIYLDGVPRAHVVANLDRMDVPEADPTVKTPNIGWRADLDYRHEPTGVHTLEVFIEKSGSRLVRIAKRGLTVVAHDQSPSLPLPSAPVDAEELPASSAIRAYVDGPAPLTPLFYNPLADLWQQYRNQVVADYIDGFAKIAGAACLPHDLFFSHQLTPQLNSSWDKELDAVDTSQKPNPDYGQGATLYGGSTWGEAFFDWKNALGWKDYAVPEMHPRFNLPVEKLDAMFEEHRRQGARYVSPYYLTITPPRLRPPMTDGLGMMMIDPSNPHLGSDAFYDAIKSVIRAK